MSNILFPQLPGLRWEMTTADEFHTLVQEAANPDYETALLLGPDPTIHFELEYSFLRQPGAQGGYGGADELNTLRGFFRARSGDFDSFLLSAPQITENPADGAIAGQALAPDANNVAPLIVTRAGYMENIYEAAGVNGNPSAAPVIRKDGTVLAPTTPATYTGTVPSSAPYSVTVPNWASDSANVTVGGTALTLASGAPAAGQYSVSTAGAYTFNSAQAGGALSIGYAELVWSIQGPGYAWSGGSYPGLVVIFTSSMAGHAITADFTWYYRVRFAQKTQEWKKFLAMLYGAQKLQLKTRRNAS